MVIDDTAAGDRRASAAHTVLLWLLPAALYYAVLLTAGGFGLFAPVKLGLTFNSMLLHMLHGRFDVDPAIIGDEGFLHNGAVYAYFGVFPALFRGLFLWLPGFAATDFTRLGCLVAVGLMALFKVLSALAVWRGGEGRCDRRLLALVVVAVLASGPQIEFLRPSIYQEVLLWADAAAAAFVWLLLRGLVGGDGFSPRLLAALAAAAGICLLTRVSTGLGLYVAFALVWLRHAWLRLRGDRATAMQGLVVSALVAVLFAAATGWVNWARWGNPLVFVDLKAALIAVRYPEQFPPIERYGEFNPIRIGYGLGYYFLPLWALRDGAGQLWWAAFQQRTIGTVELPPMSFFVTDPLLLGLAAIGLRALWRDRDARDRATKALVGIGLLVPAVLMLTAPAMTMRYRMEFYPFFEFFALLGFARLAAGRTTASAWPALVAGTAAGVVGSHAAWLLYMLSPFGPAIRALGPLGPADFYASLLR